MKRQDGYGLRQCVFNRRSRESRHVRPIRLRRPILESLESRIVLTASYSVSLHTTMTIEDTPTAGLVEVLGHDQTFPSESSTTGFPSFANVTTSADYDASTRTLTIDAEANGAAVFTGGDVEQAIASSLARAASTLVLVNPSDRFTWMLDISVSATISITATPDYTSDYVETYFALGFVGNNLDGIPDEGIVIPLNEMNTREDGFENGYDLVTNTFLLGVDTTFSVAIPPSFENFETTGEIEEYDLGLFGQAGGAASSWYDGDGPLIIAAPPPDLDVSPPEARPTVDVTGSSTIAEGEVYTLTIGEPDEGHSVEATGYRIDWGDGTAQTSISALDLAANNRQVVHVYDDGALNPIIQVDVIDEHGVHPASGLLGLSVANVAPTAVLSNDGPVDEGGAAIVSFSDQFDPSAADTDEGFRYAYDFDNDGSFDVGDGTYAGSVANSSEVVPASLLSDGPAERAIRARIIDVDGGYSDWLTTIVVNNVPPTLTSLQSNHEDVEHKSDDGFVEIVGTFSDPAGTHDTHLVRVDWGDDSGEQVLEASAVDQTNDQFASSHAYDSGGIYTITVIVVDEDGGVSASQTTMAVVTGIGVVDEVLYIIGTSESDRVQISQRKSDQVRVDALFAGSNAQAVVAVDDFDLIVSYLCEGDDRLSITRRVEAAAIVHGGAGDDHLTAGGGPTVLLGGAGDDRLKGARNRSILIGGLGSDELVGRGDGDVLIGGTTDLDESDPALEEVLAEWSSAQSYFDRVMAIESLLTVFDDDTSDHLTGGSGRDLWFDGLGDKLTGVTLTGEADEQVL